jgi:putative transposase
MRKEGMARLLVPQLSTAPYHLMSRCPNREPFGLHLDTVWSIMEDYLYYIHQTYNFRINGFVLMPNHFHLIGQTMDVPIGKVMCDFMTKTSKEINRLTGKINQNWGSRHYKCILDKEIYLLNTYKYIYQNPVRAKLCSRAEDWKYSTLNGILGGSRLIIPIEADNVLFSENFNDRQLEWLNREIKKENNAAVKLALTKKLFTLPKTKDLFLNPLEKELI